MPGGGGGYHRGDQHQDDVLDPLPNAEDYSTEFANAGLNKTPEMLNVSNVDRAYTTEDQWWIPQTTSIGGRVITSLNEGEYTNEQQTMSSRAGRINLEPDRTVQTETGRTFTYGGINNQAPQAPVRPSSSGGGFGGAIGDAVNDLAYQQAMTQYNEDMAAFEAGQATGTPIAPSNAGADYYAPQANNFANTGLAEQVPGQEFSSTPGALPESPEGTGTARGVHDILDNDEDSKEELMSDPHSSLATALQDMGTDKGGNSKPNSDLQSMINSGLY